MLEAEAVEVWEERQMTQLEVQAVVVEVVLVVKEEPILIPLTEMVSLALMVWVVEEVELDALTKMATKHQAKVVMV